MSSSASRSGARRGTSPLRLLSVVGPAAMAAAVVLTANHYVLDLVGGLAVVLFALWVVRRRDNHCSAASLHG